MGDRLSDVTGCWRRIWTGRFLCHFQNQFRSFVGSLLLLLGDVISETRASFVRPIERAKRRLAPLSRLVFLTRFPYFFILQHFQFFRVEKGNDTGNDLVESLATLANWWPEGRPARWLRAQKSRPRECVVDTSEFSRTAETRWLCPFSIRLILDNTWVEKLSG